MVTFGRAFASSSIQDVLVSLVAFLWMSGDVMTIIRKGSCAVKPDQLLAVLSCNRLLSYF